MEQDDARKQLLTMLSKKNELNNTELVVNEIQKKLDSNEKLSESDWNLIIRNLFVVGVNAVLKEENADLAEMILVLIAKIGLLVSKKDGVFYNECYKTNEVFKAYKQEREINEDLLRTVKTVSNHKDEDRLVLLLKQYKQFMNFHSSKDAYLEAYDHTKQGEISNDERLFIHAFNYAYEEEKKLVKKQFVLQLIYDD